MVKYLIILIILLEHHFEDILGIPVKLPCCISNILPPRRTKTQKRGPTQQGEKKIRLPPFRNHFETNFAGKYFSRSVWILQSYVIRVSSTNHIWISLNIWLFSWSFDIKFHAGNGEAIFCWSIVLKRNKTCAIVELICLRVPGDLLIQLQQGQDQEEGDHT